MRHSGSRIGASDRNKAERKHTGKRLTRSHSSRGFGSDFKHSPIFLPSSLISSQTYRQIYCSPSSLADSHPAGLCALCKSPTKKRSASSNSTAHYSSLQEREAPKARSYLLLRFRRQLAQLFKINHCYSHNLCDQQRHSVYVLFMCAAPVDIDQAQVVNRKMSPSSIIGWIYFRHENEESNCDLD